MIWRPKKLTREQQAERRAEAIRLLEAAEMKQVEIARYQGVTEAAVSKWKKQLAKGGLEALRLRKSSGRPAKLDQNAKQKLIQELEKGALVAGFATEQWTQAHVKKVIEREFGVSYHQNYLSRLLAELGWSVQKPEGRAIERDEELIRAWLSKDWPRIKKARRLGAEIVFEDEFGLSYTEPVGFTWAPKGHTPRLKRITKFRRETSTMVGLTISGKIYKRHFDGSINAEKMLIGLEHFRRHIQGPFILIWDQSRTHKAKIVNAFLQKHPKFTVNTYHPMHRNSIQKSIVMAT
jgi:transposase